MISVQFSRELHKRTSICEIEDIVFRYRFEYNVWRTIPMEHSFTFIMISLKYSRELLEKSSTWKKEDREINLVIISRYRF